MMKADERDNMLIRRLGLIVIIGLVLLLPLSAQEIPAEYMQLAQQVERLEKECQQRPDDVTLRVQLAEDQIKIGSFAPAEGNLEKALHLAPDHVPALVALGRLHRRKFQFEKAGQVLERIRKLAPQDIPGRMLAAGLALDRMDFPTAAAIYQDILQREPRLASALCGLAEVDYWENRYAAAEDRLKTCLEADPACTRAWLFKSLIHRIRQENTEWAACGRKAVEYDPLDDDARANLSNILMRGEKKLVEGYAEARLALKLNPYCYPAHTYIGNGWSSRVYPEIQINLAEKEKQELLQAMKTGDGALTGQKLAEADKAFDEVLILRPDYIPALISKGTVQYYQHDYDRAQDWFFKALAVDPDYGLAHYGVSLSLLRKKDRVNIRLAGIDRRFKATDVPEPATLRDVFTSYNALDPELQKIVRLSVQPLCAYLPLLKEKKVSFYIFPFHHFLWQVPLHERMKGTRTFDGRLWDDVKGDGGHNASSGAEWERDVKYLRFNVLAHEFAHQVHGFLPKELKDEIHRLYQEAKKTRKTLDFYSDANEMEYFAVGVEAYVSEDKMADQKNTYGHTRRELQQRDPDLYAFIRKLGRQAGNTVKE